ncbi:MAG: glycosyltransferase [Marinilabiliaceae bacterium]|nr:glycosyltransferase [Marinilabiliaceae bacterium]
MISIIIPCHNIVGYLEACLNSCLLQTHKNIEIIVLNDGSEDETEEIINHYALLDKRIVPIHKHNEGVAKTRQIGVEKASGEYIFFLDGDDYLPLNAIEILANEMSNSNADMVIGQGLEEIKIGYDIVKTVNNEQLTGRQLINKILTDRFFGIWGILYKRSLFDEQINFHCDLKNGEDAVLLMQLANKSKLVQCTNKIIYFYRNRKTSVTKEPTDQNFLDSIKCRFMVENYAIDYGFNKDKDFELGSFVCASLTFMILNKNFNKIDESTKILIKEKIRNYLLSNPDFRSFYSKNFHKNYSRLFFFYHFPFINESMFQKIYKILF